MSSKIHPSAVVHPKAEIDSSTEIGPFCVIDSGAKIGPGNRLISHVTVYGKTSIGSENVFHPFCAVGGMPQDLKYNGEDTSLIIGDRNNIRECVTLNIGTTQGGGVSKIGNDNLLMAYSHVAHDVVIQNNTIIGNSCQIAGHVLIEDYVTIGGMSAIAQFIRLGAHSYIGGASGLDRDVPPFVLGRGMSQDFEVWGINLVGLKRRGYKVESIRALQGAADIFFKDKTLEKEAALQKIEATYGQFSEVKQFVDFIRGSQKAVYR